jgi:hypothetical protein
MTEKESLEFGEEEKIKPINYFFNNNYKNKNMCFFFLNYKKLI